MSEDLRTQALRYHAEPQPGKITVEITKPADTAEDLALAYSPGVAEPVREIAKDPDSVYSYTGKGNSVAVITNGTAILGLGNLGPLASKPVMEGKALLFKRFANINAIDIEVSHTTNDDFIQTVANIANTFGGINLEDIKAPECFEIEKRLIELCEIPVFHDDQHGTAIVTTAGILNALEIQGKELASAKVVCSGAGAAATACMELLIHCGATRENIFMLDSKGVITTARDNLNKYKQRFANPTSLTTLNEVIVDADIFLGVSMPNVLSAENLLSMAKNPIVFACANPDPEIAPQLATQTRADLIMGTGRSDFPNQVNNVLCFPFIFRGALDSRATCINIEMKLAAVEAIRSIAKEPVTAEVLKASNMSSLEFGQEYILPKPMDSRLLPKVARAVAIAASKSGVAQVKLPKDYML